MEENSINRGVVDLFSFQPDKFDLSILPLSALANNNRLILSLLSGKDINSDLEVIQADGITEKTPFFSPLIWVGLIHILDWEQEKKILRRMLQSKIDCNYLGMCGFNLFHLYLVMALLNVANGFQKLKWWVDKPMVDCNVPFLSMKARPRIVFLHPAQFIETFPYCQHTENIVSYLLSRGMSCSSLSHKWLALNHSSPLENKYLRQRFQQQQSVRDTSFTKHYCLPTPQMNNLKDIPKCQHLIFESVNGLVFRFHASYMDTIVKTHTFPFTLEKIPQSTLQKWLRMFEKKWIPREEFVEDGFSLCQDVMIHDDKLFIHLLDQWIRPVYPYSRIMMISMFPLSEKMFQYMCWKLRTNIFHLKAFHQKCHTTWKNFFFWACYVSLNEFFFANQMEELVSQLEIYYSWKCPFSQQYPDITTFLFLNSEDDISVYKMYGEQFDYSLPQVYHIFKKMCFVVKE